MRPSEIGILRVLDERLREPRVLTRIRRIASSVEGKLESGRERLAWDTVPLELYGKGLPGEIRSSWVFVLRAGSVTGPERHSNSRQRMVSLCGSGDFQTRRTGPWESHLLVSDPGAALERRWISIPRGVWHQGVVGGGNWAVVSFHTVEADALAEERPDPERPGGILKRKYHTR